MEHVFEEGARIRVDYLQLPVTRSRKRLSSLRLSLQQPHLVQLLQGLFLLPWGPDQPVNALPRDSSINEPEQVKPGWMVACKTSSAPEQMFPSDDPCSMVQAGLCFLSHRDVWSCLIQAPGSNGACECLPSSRADEHPAAKVHRTDLPKMACPRSAWINTS